MKAAERPAHGVRDNRSPMQAPVGRAALGEAAPMTSRPFRAQQNAALTYPHGEQSVVKISN